MKKRCNRTKIWKEAGVLLIAAVVILSTGAVIANTNNTKTIYPTSITSDTSYTSEYNCANFQRNQVFIGGPLGGPSLFFQRPYLPGEDWIFHTSALDPGYKCYENFWDLTEPIYDIHWWGLTLYYTGEDWEIRDPEGMQFDIIFYSDDPEDHVDMPPSDIAQTFSNVVPSSITPYDTYSGFPCWYFSYDLLDPSVELTGGWVSIQSTYSPNDCWLLWAGSPPTEGDGFAYQQGGVLILNHDLAINLTGEEVLTVDAGGPYEAEVGEEIQFEGTASSGVPPYSYHWDFGDESGTSDVEDPTYTYDEAGVYTVNLTVTDSERAVAWDETTATITEPPPPPAELEITEIAGGMGVTATIKNVGETAATNLEWNIKVTGGFLGLVDADVDGNKSSLAVNTTEDVASGSLGFLHLGGLEITVTADADNADKITVKGTAFIIGPFVIGVSMEE